MFFYSTIYLTTAPVLAAGFGAPLVRSYLGQPLNVQVPISGVPQDELNSDCVKAVVSTLDNHHIANPRVEFTYPNSAVRVERFEPTNSAATINLRSKEPIIEPAVTLSISLKCGPLMQRTYSLLLDYAEYAAPATVVAANDNAAKVEGASLPVTTKLAKPAATQQTGDNKSAVAKSARNTQRTDTAQKSQVAVNSHNKIGKKPSDKAAPKDQLKLSNEELLPVVRVPSIVEKPVEQSINVEQQRMLENSLAQERFAAMLRNEPTLLTSQLTTKLGNDQEKIKQLETKLKQLRLQIQSNSQSKNEPAEQRFPTSLLIMNAVVLLLLFILLCAVGKLWLSLRKTHQQNLWWHASTENKQGIESQVASIDDARLHIEEQKHELDKAPEPKMVDSIVINSPILESQQSNKEVSQKELEDHLPILQESILEEEAKGELTLEEGNGTFNLFTNHRGAAIHIEELSDFTQEAEFWVSIHNPKRAIEILEPQCLNETLTMPVSLLYLLDLYRLVNDEHKYTNLRDRLKRKFNISVPVFSVAVDSSESKSLEDYEHIASRCCAFWNTNYILPYLESLLIDDREGERIGFDLAVYRDILFLIAICKELDLTRNVSTTAA